MASENFPHLHERKPTNYCPTLVVVVFITFSIFAMWIFQSSPTVLVQNSDSPYQGNDGLGLKVADRSSGNIKSQSQDAINDGKKITKEESGDAVKETKGDSAGAVEADKQEKILEKSTDGTTSSENTSDMEFGSVNGTEDKQNNDYHKEGQTREEPSMEVSNEDTDDGSGGKTTVDEESETNNDNNSSNGKNSDLDASDKSVNAEGGSAELKQEDKIAGPASKTIEQNLDTNSKRSDTANAVVIQKVDQPYDDQSETFNETTAQDGSFSTQMESQNETSSQQDFGSDQQREYSWKVCNTTAGPDYIPCLDNVYVVRRLPSTMHFEHRERHCPDEAPTCLVPLPAGYKKPVLWPKSRDKIWYNNVPHMKLAVVKQHQNWIRDAGEYVTFPGGGTQFIHGALHYIDLIQVANPDIAWGKRTRVILDVGCGVASFGGYLFERDVLAMSFAPKDEHEAQVQFALERGIPAILEVMGTKRLPFPGGVFDAVHCARCRVPWHVEGGKLLLELNRVLRPGGYFVWSATPIYRKGPEDVGIWKEMSRLTMAMCWDLVLIKKDKLNKVAIALYRKPTSNDCYENRPLNEPPLCNESDDPNLAWNVTLQACMHKVPVNLSERGSQWPEQWPKRLAEPPYWLNSLVAVHGKPAQEDFAADYEHWKDVVSHSYLNEIGVSWSSIRNAMDMRAVYGGFAAALRDLKVWVMNVILIDSPDTLPVIYERGLLGLYHDWCESFNTYPRSYDLLHADNLFSSLKRRCKLLPVFAEVDRILRPEGILIVRDDVETISEIESMAKSLQWDVRSISSKDSERLLCVQKTFWRPVGVETITSAIA